MEKTGKIFFRWLGVAGIELEAGNCVLIIDPYFTRVPFYKMWIGKVIPESKLISQHIKHCDFILVTHSHIDHLMDVPDIVNNTECRVYGSNNTCSLLHSCKIAKGYVYRIKVADILNLGKFKIEVLFAKHRNVLGFSAGHLGYPLKPPFTARQYRMDNCFAFHISVNGISFMTDPGINNFSKCFKKADVLFISASYSMEYYKLLFDSIKPKILVPLHWDNFFLPLSVALRPYFKAPSRKFPFFGKINLNEFSKVIKKIDPDLKILIPEIFKSYDIVNILN
ncbi:MAG: MBL fold metallo-hydrolase [Actinobacteria bacterium]|nr:MBL fold metallo-hydrolase [Actinomycetota bacterium]